MKRKADPLKKLILYIVLELFAVILAVWIFDPFYQYHAPFFGLQAVLNDRDNQMPGSIRNFDYDAVLIGSSTAENFDSDTLNEYYGVTTLKVIRASGSVADLLYYLEMAQEDHELTDVFWCLDLFALDADTEVTLYGGDTPTYLHTKSVLDDVPYLLNKEILFEKIPYMLAGSYLGKNTQGRAYDWSEGKDFSAGKAMQAYEKPETVLEEQDISYLEEVIAENIGLIIEQIEENPGITWRFVFPPYSMLWWDCTYVNGMLEEPFYILSQTLPALLACDNVEIYYFQDEYEIVCNLDNYMDMIHYSPDINAYMLEKMIRGENRVTEENWQDVLESMRALAGQITEEEIYRYYGD